VKRPAAPSEHARRVVDASVEHLWCECSSPTPGPGFWSIGCDGCGRLIRPERRAQGKEKVA
jgi:hypothetical protein